MDINVKHKFEKSQKSVQNRMTNEFSIEIFKISRFKKFSYNPLFFALNAQNSNVMFINYLSLVRLNSAKTPETFRYDRYGASSTLQ